MEMSRRYVIVAIAVGIGVSAGVTSPHSQTVSIQNDYLMTLEAPFDPAFQVVGQRIVANWVAGGSVHGPKINGTVIGPAGDWIIPMPDGSLRSDVRATIKTDDGELILTEYTGVLVAGKEAGDRFKRGPDIEG